MNIFLHFLSLIFSWSQFQNFLKSPLKNVDSGPGLLAASLPPRASSLEKKSHPIFDAESLQTSSLNFREIAKFHSLKIVDFLLKKQGMTFIIFDRFRNHSSELYYISFYLYIWVSEFFISKQKKLIMDWILEEDSTIRNNTNFFLHISEISYETIILNGTFRFWIFNFWYNKYFKIIIK